MEKEAQKYMTMFQYYIIMPHPSTISADTLFNRFDKNIIDALPYIQLIARLPATLDEYRYDWPISACKVDGNTCYQIHYVFEHNLKESTLELIQQTFFGVIFVLPGIDAVKFNAISSSLRLPIVTMGSTSLNALKLENDSIFEEIMDAWRISAIYVSEKLGIGKTMIDDVGIWRNNKSKLSGFQGISAHFTDPLTFTIDRIRGLYSYSGSLRYVSKKEMNEKEQEADTEIQRSLKHLLAEKFLAYMLGFIIEESFDEKDRTMCLSVGLTQNTLNDFWSKSDTPYDKLIMSILDNFDNLVYESNMVFVFPSVNYYILHKLFINTKIPQKLLRIIFDSDNYYYNIDANLLENSQGQRVQNFSTLSSLIYERGKEMAALSSLYVYYSLGQRLPFVRLRNVPSQKIYLYTFALSRYSRDMEARNKIPNFVNGINNISDIIKRSIPDEIAKIIIKNGKHIKIVSDLPVEWVKIRNIPLCIEKSFSRVPITPGNSLVAHANQINQEYLLDIKNTKVLIINSLHPTDPLFRVGKKLNKAVMVFWGIFSKRIDYFEANNKNEFFSVIERKKPTILIYYGHGIYDETENCGKLLIRDDYVSSLEIEKLQWKPLIVILGACETQVLHGTHLNVANIFLGSGVISVLGTYFPIDGRQMFSFICGLMRNLVNALAGAAPEALIKNWADVLLMTYRSHFMLEPIYSLERYLKRRGKSLNTMLPDLHIRYFQYCYQEKLNLIDQYRFRDEIYLKVLEEFPKLKSAYESLLLNHLILPQSIFYSSLGSPEKIYIQRPKKAMKINEVNTYYESTLFDNSKSKRR